MRFTNTAALVGFIASSQAFLLPTSISPGDTNLIEALPIEVAVQSEGVVLDLECKNCPVIVNGNAGPVWIEGLENKLQLSFSIEHGDIDIFTLNGAQIYPIQMPPKEIVALQVTSNDREPNYVSLGYELLTKPGPKSEQDQLEVVDIQLQIVEIGTRFVNGLESVEIQLLKGRNGRLMVVKVETASTTNSGGKDCTSFICKLRSIIQAKLAGLRGIRPGTGCPKAPAAKPDHSGTSGKEPHQGHHGVHPHHRHHGLRRFFYALKSIALHVLIPVFIGITVGLAASIVGMVVGHTVIFVWRTFRGRRQGGVYCTVQQNESEDDVHDDTKPFLEHQCPPPVYQDDVIDEKKIAL